VSLSTYDVETLLLKVTTLLAIPAHMQPIAKKVSQLENYSADLQQWCERWNIKINEGKTQAIYFSSWNLAS
jgi:hypothetical protein